MSEMHPTRWTLTAFLVFFAVMGLRRNDVEPSEWEPAAALLLSMLGITLAAFDAAVAKFAKAIPRRQRRLRYVSAGVLSVCAVTIVLSLLAAAKRNKYELDIPNSPPALLQQPYAGVEADSGTPAAEILNPNL